MLSFLSANNPVVMGILNITPDSFSDGGKFYHQQKINLDRVLIEATQMAADGAQVIDVGGESTRPGAAAISEQEELDRVIPAIEKIHKEVSTLISIDTSKARVMKEAARAGAGLINDVRALQSENALVTAAHTQLPVCLMHMQGDPRTMQQTPHYTDVVGEVKQFLQQRVDACVAAGIAKNRLIVDPGFCFGKSLEHNLSLVKHLASLKDVGCPILVGLSRKSMIGKITGSTNAQDRLAGSLALSWACLQQGAKIVRVHDVKQTVDMVKIYCALQQVN